MPDSRKSPRWLARTTRPVSRRSFFLGTGTALAGASALALVGCGDDDKTAGTAATTGAGSATAGATKSATQAARRGGILSDRLNATLPGFDPHQFISSAVSISQAPIYNGLLRYNPDAADLPLSAIEGELAEKWEQPDPLTVVFTLRKGVKFHNGSDFTSDDVKANYDWIQTPPTGKNSAYREPFLAVSAIETPDPFTVRIKLSRPSASFLAVTPHSAYAIHEGKLLRSQGQIQAPGIGTGPMKWKAYEKDNYLEVERNPAYHISGQPYLDGCKYLVQPDQDSAKASFIAGQTHLYFSNTRGPEDMDNVKSNLGDKVRVQIFNSTARGLLAINPSQAPLNNPAVRKAIQMALLRSEAIQLFTGGKSKPGGFMGPGGQWAISESELQKYPGYGPLDVAAAKQLLASAGAEGLSLTILTVPGIYSPQAELMQNQLKKIGVSTTLESLDLVSHRAKLNSGAFQIANVSVGPVLDDPDAIFGHLAVEKGAENFGHIADAKVQPLFDKQSALLDAKERKLVVQDLERAALDMNANSAYQFFAYSFASNTAVQNFRPNGALLATGRQHADLWLSA